MRSSLRLMLAIFFVVCLVSACGSGNDPSSSGEADSAPLNINLISFSTSTSILNDGSTFTAQWSVSGQSQIAEYEAKLYVNAVDDAATKTEPTSTNTIYDADGGFDGTPMAGVLSFGNNVTLPCSYNSVSTASSSFKCSRGADEPSWVNPAVTIAIPDNGTLYAILEACVVNMYPAQRVCTFKSVPLIVK